jgi:hypothetical protein
MSNCSLVVANKRDRLLNFLNTKKLVNAVNLEDYQKMMELFNKQKEARSRV